MTNKKSIHKIPYSAALVNFLIQEAVNFDYEVEPRSNRITIRCTTKQLWRLAIDFARVNPE